MGTRTGVWKSEYIWEAPDLEKIKGQRSDYLSLLDSLDSGCSILKSLILITIETVVGKDLQFVRAVLHRYSLLTSDFKHGDETRDSYALIGDQSGWFGSTIMT